MQTTLAPIEDQQRPPSVWGPRAYTEKTSKVLVESLTHLIRNRAIQITPWRPADLTFFIDFPSPSRQKLG
jgi:hypothetical protein